MENMLDKETLIKVSNRGSGVVSYIIKDMNNLYRSFFYKETKEVPMGELRALSYQPGGLTLLKDYLIVEDPRAVEELFGEVEPEYQYTEDDVKDLLLNGTLDQLKDCLDFAPQGVIDMVQSLATSLRINDISKREAIKAKTGYDITKALEIEKEMNENDETDSEVKTRRAAPIKHEEASASVRRSTPKYNVVK